MDMLKGEEAVTEQVTVSEFGAPMVHSAYKPSEKGTTKGTFYIATFGTLAAIFVGVALSFGGLFVSEYVSGRGGLGFLVGMAMIFIMFPFLGGMLIGWVIGKCAITGKSRSLKTINGAAILCSGVAIGVYLLIRMMYLEGDAFNSFIDLLKIGIPALIVWGMAYSMAEGEIISKPYCEKCDGYMLIKRSQKLSREKQGELLKLALASKNSDFLLHCFSSSGIVAENTIEPYAIAEFFYCGTCKAEGFLNINSYIVKQIRSGNKIENSTRNQLVFSKILDSNEIAAILK